MQYIFLYFTLNGVPKFEINDQGYMSGISPYHDYFNPLSDQVWFLFLILQDLGQLWQFPQRAAMVTLSC